MPRYAFPGFTVFLEAAARRIGHPEAEAPARRIATLGALANLCAQAGAADPAHAPAVLAKAAEFRDQLHAAYRAAELMLSEVHQALGVPGGPGPGVCSAAAARRPRRKSGGPSVGPATPGGQTPRGTS